jgi:hypothetical protein
MITIKTFRELALSLPDAIELPHFERTSFRANKKIFSTLDEKKALACLMLTENDQYIFSAFDKSIIYPVPNKWGLKGATYVELNKVSRKMVNDMLKSAYGKVVKKKKQ